MIGTGGTARPLGGGFGATDAGGGAGGRIVTEEAVWVADEESNGGGW